MRMLVKNNVKFLKRVLQLASQRRFADFSYLHNVGKEPLRPLTLGQLLGEKCVTFADVPAIISVHQNQRMSFGEVLDEADKLAASLRALGLKTGDRVGLWAPNLIEWYVVHMACARAGVILVNINPAFQPKEIQYCINKVGVKSLICAHKFRKQNYYDILNVIAPELSNSDPGKIKCKAVPSLESIIIITDEDLRGAYKYQEIFDLATPEGISSIRSLQNSILMDEPAHIQFTSGTTGHPKAAAVSHFSMVNNSHYVGKRNELDRKYHRMCIQVPLFHAIGTVIAILGGLHHGATMVLPSAGYNPDKNLDAIRDEKCSVIYGTPTMYVDLIDRQKQRNEIIAPEIACVGGAVCSPHLFTEMKNVLKLKRMKSLYGQTELTAVAFQTLYDEEEHLTLSTVGYIQEHLEAKVVDSEGKMVPFGTPGELCVRGYSSLLRFWDDDNRTQETMGQDKWLKTGDQFILEPSGYGRIVGRLKEMLIRGGENIFPKEIEDFLMTHPSILEVHIIGIPHERLGEEVCAVVKLNEGKSLNLEDIRNFCQGNISNFKIPTMLKIVTSFPKTTSGKIQKFKLIEAIVNNQKQENVNL
ncbi:medium-chain acyl-CoA ligase ACSF2, mitochondrial-like [Cylas formicarius]|uniref:medium-chain acyl-CoA ligase ACSF2, mitochondrial-like n=1 Tax=Cylas formicarius TaxID=197179 RepID=UPI002958D08F|nr:medium-chain acyl-CoA ligase ACSF2, mitochondrial-like [Cylas formicarius]